MTSISLPIDRQDKLDIGYWVLDVKNLSHQLSPSEKEKALPYLKGTGQFTKHPNLKNL